MSENKHHYTLQKEAQIALEKGYDAVIAYNTFDGEIYLDQYIVFSPYQIKELSKINLMVL